VDSPSWVSIAIFLLGFAGQATGLIIYINKQGDRALDRIGRVEQRIFDKLAEAQSAGDTKREALAQLVSQRMEGIRRELELVIEAKDEKQSKGRHDFANKLTLDFRAFADDVKRIERELARVERESVPRSEIRQELARIEASIINRIDRGDGKFEAMAIQVAELVTLEKHRREQQPAQAQGKTPL
jgi:hypothetical protein